MNEKIRTLAEKIHEKTQKKIWTKNTQTSIIKYMDEKHRKTWIKNTQTSIIKYMKENTKFVG